MKSLLAVLALLALLMLYAPPAVAHQGCTPGFWKNNLTPWTSTPFTTDTTLAVAFPGVTPESWARYGIASSDTLLDALRYSGGPGLSGAARIYLRTAAAALLNAAHPLLGFTGNGVAWVQDTVAGDLNVAYCFTGPGLCMTDAAVREALLGRASLWDGFNNESCSIDAHGNLSTGAE